MFIAFNIKFWPTPTREFLPPAVLTRLHVSAGDRNKHRLAFFFFFFFCRFSVNLVNFPATVWRKLDYWINSKGPNDVCGTKQDQMSRILWSWGPIIRLDLLDAVRTDDGWWWWWWWWWHLAAVWRINAVLMSRPGFIRHEVPSQLERYLFFGPSRLFVWTLSLQIQGETFWTRFVNDRYGCLADEGAGRRHRERVVKI